jgi:hypothetical protein
MILLDNYMFEWWVNGSKEISGPFLRLLIFDAERR